jgi:cytochrome c biogenesis protein CcmG, thiol:disulfide interchange protein DsbE
MTRERILLGAIAVLGVGLAVAVYPTLDQRVVNAGDSAPSFSVKTDSGRTITAADFGGRVLVLNFWASWCQPCIEEFGGLSKFAQDTAGDGVVVLAVSVDRSEKAYKRFIESTRPNFQTVRDAEADVPSSYGTFIFPETYIISKDGKVQRKIIGAIQDWKDLRAAVKSI